MSDLNISNRQSGNVTIVDLAGKIALGESNRALHEAIRGLTADGKKNILLNLSNVTLIDSSGLGELVASYASVERGGGAMKLSNLSDRFIELITITKLYTVSIFSTTRQTLSQALVQRAKRLLSPLSSVV